MWLINSPYILHLVSYPIFKTTTIHLILAAKKKKKKGLKSYCMKQIKVVIYCVFIIKDCICMLIITLKYKISAWTQMDSANDSRHLNMRIWTLGTSNVIALSCLIRKNLELGVSFNRYFKVKSFSYQTLTYVIIIWDKIILYVFMKSWKMS